MRYWWVNHKKTAKQEISGGYLWSPFQESHGARSQYYENMRGCAPGDKVLSYAFARVAHIGTVSDYCRPFPKPTEFGKRGDDWDAYGWLVPVSWEPVPLPVRPKEYIGEIAPLLPRKYSPIRSDGNGNQKAYLTGVSQHLYDRIVQWGGAASTSIGQKPVATVWSDIEDRLLPPAEPLDSTQSEQVVQARRGQGKFRENVEQIEKYCRLTRVGDRRILLASHVKPWRCCTTAAERLDGNNGLLLSPTVDKLFDKGFITFLPTGDVQTSPLISASTLNLLGLTQRIEQGVGSFSDEQEIYLSYHRRYVFKP